MKAIHPLDWHEVYKKLLDYAENHKCTPWKPPPPFILAACVMSDADKAKRWEEQKVWARLNGCESLIADIPADQFYTGEQ